MQSSQQQTVVCGAVEIDVVCSECGLANDARCIVINSVVFCGMDSGVHHSQVEGV